MSGNNCRTSKRVKIIWSEKMNPGPPYMTTSTLRGRIDSTDFNDILSLGNLETAAISRIIIRCGTLVDSIKVYYAANGTESDTHGGGGGGSHEINLETGEFIKRIEGFSGASISQLTFVTNKRKWGPYGGSGGEPFAWDAAEGVPHHIAPHMMLLCFSGRSDLRLDQLQAHFIENSPVGYASKKVKYETLDTAHSHSPVGSAETPLPKFALHLMSPIITLYVGTERIAFHAYEDTLCQLSFFRAALQGGFMEASEKTVNMPEDDPSIVSVLMEFLYTGSYTYTYDIKGAKFRLEESQDPVGDLTEGIFHVAVYAIASKYDCPGLVDMALKNFKAVLDEVDEIDALRLWKAAYAEGIQLPDLKTNTDQYSYGRELLRWVSLLFKEHREEVEATMSENPDFGCDLLRLSTAGYS